MLFVLLLNLPDLYCLLLNCLLLYLSILYTLRRNTASKMNGLVLIKKGEMQ